MSYSAFPVPRGQLEGRLVRRAWSDAAFRELLLSDPRRAVEEEFGVDLPPWMEVTAVEERTDRMVIVLPVDTSGFRSPSVDAMVGRPAPTKQAPTET